MNRKLRMIVGICFLIGAVVFAIMKEYIYAPIFALVGGLYVYKSVKE